MAFKYSFVLKGTLKVIWKSFKAKHAWTEHCIREKDYNVTCVICNWKLSQFKEKRKIERKKEKVHRNGTKLELVEPNKHSLVHTNNCFIWKKKTEQVLKVGKIEIYTCTFYFVMKYNVFGYFYINSYDKHIHV